MSPSITGQQAGLNNLRQKGSPLAVVFHPSYIVLARLSIATRWPFSCSRPGMGLPTCRQRPLAFSRMSPSTTGQVHGLNNFPAKAYLLVVVFPQCATAQLPRFPAARWQSSLIRCLASRSLHSSIRRRKEKRAQVTSRHS